MYKIFVCTNINFGEWDLLKYDNRDVANTVALEFIHDKYPVVTSTEGKIKFWNINHDYQPTKLDITKYPKIDVYAKGNEHVELYDMKYFIELYAYNFDDNIGAKRVTQTFFTYKEDPLFEIKKID